MPDYTQSLVSILLAPRGEMARCLSAVTERCSVLLPVFCLF